MNFLDEIDLKNISWLELWNQFLLTVFHFGAKLILCIILYIVGKKLIKYVDELCEKMMTRSEVDPTVKSFLKNLINIALMAVLIILIVNIFGINNTSFVALFASIGVAIGMALSGTLQNFAGGVIILLLKPYRVGDYIEAQNQAGTVKEIQIFNTVLTTPDNRTIFIPNGSLSTGIVMNYSHQVNRRVELIVGISYGQDFDKAKQVISGILIQDSRILKDPEQFIAINKLNDSSVDIIIRVWTPKEEFWNVYFDLNEKIYKTFSEEGIDIPFPQLTVHLDRNND
ncbi:MAG: mechanosensitive ion channel [Dysgonamonadaceae bacterium]|jgi:small conductance mechanosensitive channel|nr:mechanosensitive ion channel [Dysgonamonadaceae bacterium]